MKIVLTVREDLPEVVVAVVDMTVQDEEKVMTFNRMVVIHAQATTTVLPIPVIVIAIAHDLGLLQQAEASQQRNAIGTKCHKNPQPCK